MKYALAILVSTLATVSTGQSFGKRTARNDTIVFPNFHKSRTNQFEGYEYPTPGTTFDYYQLKNVNGDVIIQHSGRKGGPYIDPDDPDGKKVGSVIFWARVINDTANPLELTVMFPADSFAVGRGSYFKIFLPRDTMTLDKAILYAYGATGLDAFLDTGLHTPTMKQSTISPKGEFLFYIVVIGRHTAYPTRAELVLKDKDVFLKLGGTASRYDFELIPCGHIIVKN